MYMYISVLVLDECCIVLHPTSQSVVDTGGGEGRGCTGYCSISPWTFPQIIITMYHFPYKFVNFEKKTLINYCTVNQ